MKKVLFAVALVFISFFTKAQQIENIYIHLYTDSLKKGTSNYINIDGKTQDGRWLPLTAHEISFSSNYGSFEGNDLVLPAIVPVTAVTIKAVLKSNAAISRQITIWIKQKPDPPLPPSDGDAQPRRFGRRPYNYF